MWLSADRMSPQLICFLEIGMIHRLTTEHALLIHAACFQKGVGKLFHWMLFSLVEGGNLKILLPTTL